MSLIEAISVEYGEVAYNSRLYARCDKQRYDDREIRAFSTMRELGPTLMYT